MGAGNRDLIGGFNLGDVVDVSAIDASATFVGNNTFTLDTNASFSESEIRQTVSGSSLVIDFNCHADSAAEMQIVVAGRTTPLAAGEFAL